jgi:hypothetical protein
MSLPLADAARPDPVLAGPEPAAVAEPPAAGELELLHAVAARASTTASPAIISFKTCIVTQPLRCAGIRRHTRSARFPRILAE